MQLISVMSLLSSDTPNIDSPANVDAAVNHFVFVLELRFNRSSI